jgi:hypothetical protein
MSNDLQRHILNRNAGMNMSPESLVVPRYSSKLRFRGYTSTASVTAIGKYFATFRYLFETSLPKQLSDIRISAGCVSRKT